MERELSVSTWGSHISSGYKDCSSASAKARVETLGMCRQKSSKKPMYLLIVTILFSNLQDIPQNFLQIREEVTTAAYLYQPLYEL